MMQDSMVSILAPAPPAGPRSQRSGAAASHGRTDDAGGAEDFRQRLTEAHSRHQAADAPARPPKGREGRGRPPCEAEAGPREESAPAPLERMEPRAAGEATEPQAATPAAEAPPAAETPTADPGALSVEVAAAAAGPPDSAPPLDHWGSAWGAAAASAPEGDPAGEAIPPAAAGTGPGTQGAGFRGAPAGLAEDPSGAPAESRVVAQAPAGAPAESQVVSQAPVGGPGGTVRALDPDPAEAAPLSGDAPQGAMAPRAPMPETASAAEAGAPAAPPRLSPESGDANADRGAAEERAAVRGTRPAAAEAPRQSVHGDLHLELQESAAPVGEDSADPQPRTLEAQPERAAEAGRSGAEGRQAAWRPGEVAAGPEAPVRAAAPTGGQTPAAGRHETPGLREGHWDQLVEKAVFNARHGVSEARIDLKPDHLGSLRLQILTENAQVSVRIVAETAAARDLLESHLQSLRQELQNQGLKVETFDVALADDPSRQRQSWPSPAMAGQRRRRPETILPPEGDGAYQRAGAPPRTVRPLGGIDYFA